MDDLDILSYGISMTTLEEVFIKANGDHEEEAKRKSIEPGSDAFFAQEAAGEHRNSSIQRQLDKQEEQEEGGMSSENLVGKGTLCVSIWALLVKRFNVYKRDKCGLICEVLVPVLLVFLGLALLQIGWLSNSPAYVLDTSAYPGPQRMLFNNENVKSSVNQWTPQDLAAGLPSPGYFDVTYDMA